MSKAIFGGSAGLNCWITLWALVKLPSTSAAKLAGSTRSASAVVSLWKKSWATRKSALSSHPVTSSLWMAQPTGSSPKMKMFRKFPSFRPLTRLLPFPGRLSMPQVLATISLCSRRDSPAGRRRGSSPISCRPWLLFFSFNAKIPLAVLPRRPVIIARLCSSITALALNSFSEKTTTACSALLISLAKPSR